MEEIHALRDKHRADVAVLIVDDPQGCGLATRVYADADGCPRVPVWSSPKVLIKGDPAGTPQQDNARVIAEQAARVADFR